MNKYYVVLSSLSCMFLFFSFLAYWSLISTMNQYFYHCLAFSHLHDASDGAGEDGDDEQQVDLLLQVGLEPEDGETEMAKMSEKNNRT